MLTSADLLLSDLFLFAGLLLFPALLLHRWKLLSLNRALLISVVRMVVQLMLVGLYLKYLFELNHAGINMLWLLVMVTVANISVLKGAGLSVSRMFWVTQFSLTLAIALVAGLFLWVLVKPQPFMDAQYLIPVAGMLLGNCLQGNIRALETFYEGIRTSESTFLSNLLLGATLVEATEPFLKKAMRSSLTPMLESMATLGIVSLPGMMTGQILGGASPLIAAKYQIAIMIGIFLAMTCAIAMNLRLSLRVAFDESGLLRQEVFTARRV